MNHGHGSWTNDGAAVKVESGSVSPTQFALSEEDHPPHVVPREVTCELAAQYAKAQSVSILTICVGM